MRGDRAIYVAWQNRRLYYECSFCHYAHTVPLSQGSRGEKKDCETCLRAILGLQMSCRTIGTFGPARHWLSIRRPLETGSYAEVTLRDPELGWFGIADLISLSEEHCEIRDFKTGQPSDDHAFQLRVYALLWWRDPERNPTRRRATKLVLTYGNKDVSVSVPEKPELESLARELATRGRAARASASVTPPEARPGPEKCRYCSVRHLCEAYWRPSTQRLLSSRGRRTGRFWRRASCCGVATRP